MQEIKTAATQSTAGRAQQLQFLRFLAFLNIFLWHAEAWNFFNYPAGNGANLSVSFFFCLSGLVAGYSHYGREIKLGLPEIGRYMWKKIRKVYPLYALTMMIPLLYSGIPELIAARDIIRLTTELESLAGNLLLIQSWFSDGYFHLNGVAWFLSTLMFLNLFNLPAMYLLHKTEKFRHQSLFLAGALAAVGLLAAFYCGITRNLERSYWHYIFPPARLGEYLAGMILGFGIRSVLPRLQWETGSRIAFTVWEAGSLVLWTGYLHWWGFYWTTHSVHWLVPNLFLLAAFTVGKGWISELFRRKPLVWLGDISFECFLVHQLIILRYESLHSACTVSRLDQSVAFGYCLLMTVVAAAILHKGTKQ